MLSNYLLIFFKVLNMTYVAADLLTSDTKVVILNLLITILSVSNLLEDHLKLIIF